MSRQQRAVWGWVVAASLLLALAIAQLHRLAPEMALREALPIWVFALATFAVQSLPIHIATAGGRHTVVLTEVVLAVGLVSVAPAPLVGAVMVGAIPALIRLRPPVVKFAVNLLQSGLWVALPALLFHSVVDVVDLEPAVVGAAFLACFVSYMGSNFSVRVPIGLASGQWRVEEVEFRQLAASSVTALGAAALALIGVLLVDRSTALVGLLLVPVAQIVLATEQQARSVDRRAALDFTVDAAQRLRESQDLPTVLRDLLPGFRAGFGVQQAALLLTVGSTELSMHVDDEGIEDRFVGSLAAMAWLDEHHDAAPTTLRLDSTLTPVAAALGVRELLLAPVSVEGGRGALVLAGRPLGPFRNDHVELVRTVVAATSSALERHLIARDLDAAETRGVELERRASHDPLTSLANRALFERELAATLASGTPCALLFVDLDDFKIVNDTHGHAAGDAVLVAAGRRLARRIRAGDVAARLGGDEFAVLVRNRGHRDATMIAERILVDFAEPVRDAAGLPSIRAAIGVTESQPGDSPADLLARADGAMYVAKRAGGHRVEIATV